jgi:hypothetical protein
MSNPLDDMRDIFLLTQMTNADAKHVNQHLVEPSSKNSPVILDPRKVMSGMENLVRGGEREAALPIMPTGPTGPTVLGPTGENLYIPPSAPLLPMPDGYVVPTRPVIPQATPVQSAPVVGNVVVQPTTPPPNSNQLEFNLLVEKREEYMKALTWFEEKFILIEQQNNLINSKLNELLSRKRAKYAPRTKSTPAS